MTFRDLILTVLGNLGRMRWRTALTASGVIIGTTALVLLVSLGVGLQRLATDAIVKQFGAATIVTVTPFGQGSPMSSSPSQSSAPADKKNVKLDDEAVRRLRRMDHVEAVVPALTIPLLRLRYRRLEGPPADMIGIDRRALTALGLKSAKGRATLNGKNVLLGAQVAKVFFDTKRNEPADNVDLVGKQLEFTIDKGGEVGPGAGPMSPVGAGKGPKWRSRVAGILEAGGFESDFSIYISDTQAKKLAKHMPRETRRQYSWVKLKIDSGADVVSTQKQVEKMGYTASSLADILKGINSFFMIIQAVLGGVASIALLVAAFGIANTMTMAIYERTREIGIMKAIGAAGGDIMRIFLAEAATIGFIGGLGGVVSGFLLGKVINLGLYMYLAEQMRDIEGGIISTPLWLVLFTLVFATGIGLISGVFPASRASRLSPLGALRHE